MLQFAGLVAAFDRAHCYSLQGLLLLLAGLVAPVSCLANDAIKAEVTKFAALRRAHCFSLQGTLLQLAGLVAAVGRTCCSSLQFTEP